MLNTPTRHKLLAREIRPGDVLVELEWGHLGRKPIRRKVHSVASVPGYPQYVRLNVDSDTEPGTMTGKNYERSEWVIVEREAR